MDLEELPHRESIKSTSHFYNGKINYGLVVRFLRGKIGENWDDVYSEIINRIPLAIRDYKEMIFWFVADKVAFERVQPKLSLTRLSDFLKTPLSILYTKSL